MTRISVIVPTLNEALSIQFCLASLRWLREAGHQVIVVDGGSTDATIGLAEDMADLVVNAPRGRASQLNVGAQTAQGDVLLFLHADTLLTREAEAQLREFTDGGLFWGRFDVRLSGANPMFRIIEFSMNLRSRLTGIATGDQAMFVSRELYQMAGGFPDIELMEDIRFSAQLKQFRKPLCCRAKVLASSRRWESRGILRTVLTMFHLRLRYALGASPASLARDYD